MQAKSKYEQASSSTKPAADYSGRPEEEADLNGAIDLDDGGRSIYDLISIHYSNLR